MDASEKRAAPPGMPIIEENTRPQLTVVRPDDVPQAAERRGQPRTGPKWESEARSRVQTAIRKFAKPLADMAARDANEGDTRVLVTDMLCDALGYDKYADLTTEYQVRGEFADYGLRIDKQLVAFIEVKRVATKLNVRHLRQVEMYAVNEGVEWIILTNGAEWQVYHITGGMPVQVDLAFTTNLLNDDPVSAKADALFFLTRESLKRRQIDELWRAKRATSPKSLAQVLLAPSVITEIRRELKRSTGHAVEDEEIMRLLRETMLRAECL